MWQSEVEFEHDSTMVKNEFIMPIKLAGWCASLNYRNYLLFKEIRYRNAINRAYCENTYL